MLLINYSSWLHFSVNNFISSVNLIMWKTAVSGPCFIKATIFTRVKLKQNVSCENKIKDVRAFQFNLKSENECRSYDAITALT